MRDRIIVALDMPDAEVALETARVLRGHAAWVKVGMTLFYSQGPQIIRDLRSMGYRVFVDLKLHDIPHQVEGACKTLVRQGADLITVHASGGEAMLRAAVTATAQAAEKFGVERPKIVAVTVLTSLDDAALGDIGCTLPVCDQVHLLAALAAESGVDGVVCSVLEAHNMRSLLGPDALVITPGIRPSWSESGDQRRVATPSKALEAGASHLVIGRSITDADDPVAAFKRIIVEG